MKQILTIILNPTIDLSSSSRDVFPEHKSVRAGAQ